MNFPIHTYKTRFDPSVLSIISVGIVLVLLGLVLFRWPAPDFRSIPILATADLSAYEGIHRLIIIFPGDDKKEGAFIQEWQGGSMPRRMASRSLLLYRVVDQRVIGELRSRMAPGERGYRIWLVGTGGQLLFTTGDDVGPENIFAQIDSLPGRRDEIQRYNNWVAGHEDSP